MMTVFRPLVVGAVLLTLGLPGRAWALDAEEFEARLAEVVRAGEGAAGLRRLESMGAEALQAGRLDLRVQSTVAHVRLRLKAGEFGRVRQDLEEARLEARGGGWPVAEAWVNEVFADYWLAQGDGVAAAEWLEASWLAALAAVPAESGLAMAVLERLEELRGFLGQGHLAAQAGAWRRLLSGAAGVAEPGLVMQPAALSTQVAVDEVGRARFFLANASAGPLTGTLLVDGGDLVVDSWQARGGGESVKLQFPSVAGVIPQSTAQGRKLTLLPGETRTLTLEIDPNAPPRTGDRTVSVTWQAGAQSTTSTARFYFRKKRDLPDTSVANSCLVRLSPLVSVPIQMEVYHRGDSKVHLQDLLPMTSRPCRVELYEISPDGGAGRRWLAVDGNGDGSYRGVADAVVTDGDGSGFPDVEFSAGKQVVALEVRLYPLAAEDGSMPAEMDLTVSLRDGGRWREPADVRHRVESGEPPVR